LNKYNIKTLDIIANLHNFKSLNDDIQKLNSTYGICVNYSVNSNFDFLCSTNQSNLPLNAKDLYFTSHATVSIPPFLVPSQDLITYLININCLSMTSYGYKMTKNVVIDFSTIVYSSHLTAGIIFNGNGKTIKIINTGIMGLFMSGGSDGNNVIVKNLTVKAPSTYGGGIIYPTQNWFTLTNCKFYGIVQGIYEGINCDLEITFGSGGICGYGCQNFTIDNCKNYWKIGQKAGGICGYGCRNFTIRDCKNFGHIIGDYAGGICGSGLLTLNGDINSIVNIKNCFNSGKIIGNGAGGIFGSHCGFSSGYTQIATVTNIYNCINKGDVGSIGSGGICGFGCGYISENILNQNQYPSNVTINITHCRNYGNVYNECGGICGSYCSATDSSNASVTNVNIYKCKNFGDVHEIGGGIVGRFSNNSIGSLNTTNLTITKCTIKCHINNGSGGVVGPDSYPYMLQNNDLVGTSLLIISKCNINVNYSLACGIILGNNCAGYNASNPSNPSIVLSDNHYSKSNYDGDSKTNKYHLFKNLYNGTIVQIL